MKLPECFTQWCNDFFCKWKLPFHFDEMVEWNYKTDANGEVEAVTLGREWTEFVIGYRFYPRPSLYALPIEFSKWRKAQAAK